MGIKQIAKRIAYGPKADSQSYIVYLRSKGMRIGEDVTIYVPTKTTVDETYPWLVSIGDHVRIAQGAIILVHDYSWSVLKNAFEGQILGASGKVVIGNNVFIGMNAIITRGVTIGNNVIIGAGSIVTKDCADNGVYAGNPARRIAELSDFLVKRQAAQVEEAKTIALAYFERCGMLPPPAVFREYFMLFENCESAKMKEWSAEVLALCGNKDDSIDFMRSNPPMFENYEAFLKYCFGNEIPR